MAKKIAEKVAADWGDTAQMSYVPPAGLLKSIVGLTVPKLSLTQAVQRKRAAT